MNKKALEYEESIKFINEEIDGINKKIKEYDNVIKNKKLESKFVFALYNVFLLLLIAMAAKSSVFLMATGILVAVITDIIPIERFIKEYLYKKECIVLKEKEVARLYYAKEELKKEEKKLDDIFYKSVSTNTISDKNKLLSLRDELNENVNENNKIYLKK